MELRVQAGWNNFKHLKPWLCRKHKISLQLRLHLMQTCLLPTICYGIFYVGIHQQGLRLLSQTLHQMYRRIIGNLPHRTRESHQTVLERFQILPPLARLHQLLSQAHQSLHDALTRVGSTDIIHRTNWNTLNNTRTLLTTELFQPEGYPVSDSESDEVACIYCAFMAPNLQELQRHHTRVHAMPRQPIRSVNYKQDTTGGMPQ